MEKHSEAITDSRLRHVATGLTAFAVLQAQGTGNHTAIGLYRLLDGMVCATHSMTRKYRDHMIREIEEQLGLTFSSVRELGDTVLERQVSWSLSVMERIEVMEIMAQALHADLWEGITGRALVTSRVPLSTINGMIKSIADPHSECMKTTIQRLGTSGSIDTISIPTQTAYCPQPDELATRIAHVEHKIEQIERKISDEKALHLQVHVGRTVEEVIRNVCPATIDDEVLQTATWNDIEARWILGMPTVPALSYLTFHLIDMDDGEKAWLIPRERNFGMVDCDDDDDDDDDDDVPDELAKLIHRVVTRDHNVHKPDDHDVLGHQT
jgi:hypothetical protein